jgi:hypothetical protein
MSGPTSEPPRDAAREIQSGAGPADVASAAASSGDPAPAARVRRLETPGAFAIMTIYLGLFVVTWLLAFVYLGVRWAIE